MGIVLITGANRGLGLEFCRQYAADGWQVIACCRHPAQAEALQTLAGQYGNIQLETLDVMDFGSIEYLSAKLADSRIDVLLNNAGVYHDNKTNGFGQLDYPLWLQSFVINTQAPVKMAEAFLPQLQRGGQKLIANVSSLMGSMTDNTSGGSLFYRSSKAALNAAMKSLAIELKPQAIGVLTLHPGWVKTDMGGPNALIEAEESISGMRKVMAGFTLQQSGDFLKYDGTLMPW
ncbi:MAG: SDR family oxidoreductase [Methylovulum sp.]|uniref:SDR family oxidoreductase n=1 Tax=Methylovulum sp. TaxID=1916980 RepID=UPI00262FE811|nr:SDR family oxidoreductase [Methylovulum sp.]MDD2723407.1 SDR family oxidoreductase [Methylovulum sp.]MDD5125059.1 SDR family oxidoreductase [Methylovulum sp.]